MLNKTCNEFIDALASREPVPGGGGASAYVAALGMALGNMVGNLTVGKKKYKDVEEEILGLMERGEALMERLKELVSEDAEAFRPLSDAYRLPAGTEEEKAFKEAQIQRALPEAARVPMEIAKLSVEVIRLQETFAEKGSVLAVSDAGCGAAFARSALMSARLNVLINLKLMEEGPLKEAMRREIDGYTGEGLELADRVFGNVEERL
ncbi:MAG: cyclodeaminase/cyclohydrolase family protein [Firmicutes bacterium]|jgi:formiminotetrahydrofolate cyclodeaminase|nr:cyclodeaminase/cyclohydrolase family protein [Bacillota bacterium]MBR6503698.1 cyclodeaminase/cyclohydrolase family protein [Bacillota bacterium]